MASYIQYLEEVLSVSKLYTCVSGCFLAEIILWWNITGSSSLTKWKEYNLHIYLIWMMLFVEMICRYLYERLLSDQTIVWSDRNIHNSQGPYIFRGNMCPMPWSLPSFRISTLVTRKLYVWGTWAGIAESLCTTIQQSLWMVAIKHQFLTEKSVLGPWQ